MEVLASVQAKTGLFHYGTALCIWVETCQFALGGFLLTIVKNPLVQIAASRFIGQHLVANLDFA
jgi:hypothetical protein